MEQRIICPECKHTFTQSQNNISVNDFCPFCYGEDICYSPKLILWEKDIYVNVYIEEQAYGGPEEGGWWYLCGDPVSSCLCDSWQEAINQYNNFCEKFDSPYSVRLEPNFAESFPKYRPHYE